MSCKKSVEKTTLNNCAVGKEDRSNGRELTAAKIKLTGTELTAAKITLTGTGLTNNR